MSSQEPTKQPAEQKKGTNGGPSSANRRRRNPNRPAMSRPKPKGNRRENEIGQLVKLYKPEKVSETLFKVQMKPSDPDFPFDVQFVSFDLTIPMDYPKSGPSVHVTNKDIPVGYSANVDLGFQDSIVSVKLGKARLLDMLLELDKRLEEFLSREKQQTFKIVKRAKKPVDPPTESSSSAPKTKQFNYKSQLFVPQSVMEEQTRQIKAMEVRLKDDVKLQSRTDSGTTYTVFIHPSTSDSDILITELSHQFKANLFIPKDYPLSPVSLTIPVSDISARNIESNFNSHAKEYKTQSSLLSLLNFLTERIRWLILSHSFVSSAQKELVKEQTAKENLSVAEGSEEIEATNQLGNLNIEDENDTGIDSAEEEDKPETPGPSEIPLKAIDSSKDSHENNTTLARRGIELSFLMDDFVNVAFMECHTLNIQVECGRCKTVNDMDNLISGAYGRESKPVYSQCKKCQLELAAAFRKDIMHGSSSIVGYLDLSECIATDYQPSMFLLTCENCTTTSSKQLKADLGRKLNQICQSCHTKMLIKINTFTFKIMANSSSKLPRRGEKSTAKLKLHAGTPLPNEGCCSHYKKSHRWFRFSCCSKVFPCDRCHDEQSNHPNEQAFRMICGHCSKEQPFKKECAFCAFSFDKSHSPFWEGGKGTRDRTKMSRKDPRKYKKSAEHKEREKEKVKARRQAKKEGSSAS